MPGKLSVELNPARIEMEPGAPPVEAVVTIQNLGDLVEQYSVDVIGLDSDWYTAPVSSVGLFPQDRDQIRISIHPPKRPGVKAGAFHFQVRVRARGGGAEEKAEGVLDVRGFAVFRVELSPRRRKAKGQGQFKVQLSNSGTADVRLALEAQDDEDACLFRLPDDPVLVSAGSKTEVPISVVPKKRPFSGAEKSYSFTLTARPEGSRGDPQKVQGQYTFEPFMRNWGCVLRIVLVVLVIGLLVLGAGTLLRNPIVSRLVPQRLQVARGQLCGTLFRVPVLGGLCGAGPRATTVETRECTFEGGFKEFSDAEKTRVGACTTDVAYDGFGNGIQYTRNGTLIWIKASNTVYFFTGQSLYVRVADKTRLLDGPPK